MIRTVCRLVIATGILFWLAADLNAQEAQGQAVPLKKAVLVLPLQAGKGVPADKQYLGFGAQAVLENMLVLHRDLEETFAIRLYSIPEQQQKNSGLFPEQKDLQAWLAGTSTVPEAAEKSGFRYIVTGKVNVRGERVVTDLELLNKTGGRSVRRSIRMDFPGLVKFRESFLEMLNQAGIPVPAAQKAGMIWKESMPFQAFALLARGRAEDISADIYQKGNIKTAAQTFSKGRELSPQSYLLTAYLGQMALIDGKNEEAKKLFEQGFSLNPAGWMAANGMVVYANTPAIKDEELAEEWTIKRAVLQGRDPKLPLIIQWRVAGGYAYLDKDYGRAMHYFDKGLLASQELNDPQLEANLLWWKGEALFARGDHQRHDKPDEAREDFLQALKIFHELGKKDRQYRDRERVTYRNLASLYSSGGDLDTALEYDKQSLSLAKELGLKAVEASSLIMIGVQYFKFNREDEAINYFNQALRLSRDLNLKTETINSLRGLGLTYSGKGDAQAAANHFNEALALLGEALGQEQDPINRASILKDIADTHSQLGDLRQAIESFDKALQIYNHNNDRKNASNVLRGMGMVYNQFFLYDDAIKAFNQALEIGNPDDVLTRSSISLAYLYSARFNAKPEGYQKAHDYSKKNLETALRTRDKSMEINTLLELSGIYHEQGQLSKGIEYAEQALEQARKLNNLDLELAALNALTDIYVFLRRSDKLLEDSSSTLESLRRRNDTNREVQILANIGRAYQNEKLFEQAAPYLEQVFSFAPKTARLDIKLHAYTQLGQNYAALGNEAKAVEIFREALSLANQTKGDSLKNRYLKAIVTGSFGVACYRLKRYDQAVSHLEQAISLMEESRFVLGEPGALNILGSSYSGLKQYEKAIKAHQRALILARDLKNREFETDSLNNLMQVYKAVNKPRVAIFYGKQTVNIFQGIRREILGLDRLSQKSFVKSKEDIYRELADLLVSEGRLIEAEQVLTMLKEEEYFDFIRRDSDDGSAKIGNTTATPEEEQWEKQYREIQQREDVIILGERYSLLRAKQEKNLTSEPEKKELLELDEKVGVLRQAFEKLLKDMEQQLGQSQQAGRRMSEVSNYGSMQEVLQALRNETGPGTVALYAIAAPQRYNLILVTPGSYKAVTYDIAAKDLYAKVQAFRKALTDPRSDPEAQAQELYKILIGDRMAKYLKQANAHTLLWSLDGVLRYVPIAALHDGQNYLVEKYNNVMFTLANLRHLTERTSRDWTVAGFGVSKASKVVLQASEETFNALPGVSEELNKIVQAEGQPGSTGVMPGIVRLDESFDKRALREAIVLGGYKVLHIASHFRFNIDNRDSFLLLGNNGALTLSDFNSYGLGGVELLTLSACDTIGMLQADGREIEGLGMSAQGKGAKAVIATLWSVADRSTSLFMQAFYRQRAHLSAKNNIRPKVEALRWAQLSLLYGKDYKPSSGPGSRGPAVASAKAAPSKPNSDAPFAHPYYWAPFILMGNAR